MGDPTRGNTQMSLLFTQKEDLLRDTVTNDSLACSVHGIGEFTSLRGVGNESIKDLALQVKWLQLIQSCGSWDPTGGSSEGQRSSAKMPGV